MVVTVLWQYFRHAKPFGVPRSGDAYPCSLPDPKRIALHQLRSAPRRSVDRTVGALPVPDQMDPQGARASPVAVGPNFVPYPDKLLSHTTSSRLRQAGRSPCKPLPRRFRPSTERDRMQMTFPTGKKCSMIRFNGLCGMPGDRGLTALPRTRISAGRHHSSDQANRSCRSMAVGKCGSKRYREKAGSYRLHAYHAVRDGQRRRRRIIRSRHVSPKGRQSRGCRPLPKPAAPAWGEPPCDKADEEGP